MLHDINSLYNFYQNADILHAPFAKIYHKDLINRNKIRFIEGLSLGEDLCFNMDYLEHCTNGAFVDSALYYYRNTEGSLSKKIKGDYADIQMMLFDRKMDFITRKSINYDFSAHAPGIVRDIFLSECQSQATLSVKIGAINRLKKHRLMKLCKNNNSVSNCLIIYAIKLLPFSIIKRFIK